MSISFESFKETALKGWIDRTGNGKVKKTIGANQLSKSNFSYLFSRGSFPVLTWPINLDVPTCWLCFILWSICVECRLKRKRNTFSKIVELSFDAKLSKSSSIVHFHNWTCFRVAFIATEMLDEPLAAIMNNIAPCILKSKRFEVLRVRQSGTRNNA